MRLISVTIKAAFLNADDMDADAVREVIHRAVSDGLGAQVAYTTNAEEWDDPMPDPNLDTDDASAFEPWEEHAHEQLDGQGKPCTCDANPESMQDCARHGRAAQ